MSILDIPTVEIPDYDETMEKAAKALPCTFIHIPLSFILGSKDRGLAADAYGKALFTRVITSSPNVFTTHYESVRSIWITPDSDTRYVVQAYHAVNMEDGVYVTLPPLQVDGFDIIEVFWKKAADFVHIGFLENKDCRWFFDGDAQKIAECMMHDIGPTEYMVMQKV